MRILMVDDSRAIHAAVAEILTSKAELVHVFDGQEAINELERKEIDKYDLVLLDWEMPVMTGPETLEKMKSRGITVPVVMMTSKNSPQDISRMINAGAIGYIIKPFTQDILLGKLSEIFDLEI